MGYSHPVMTGSTPYWPGQSIGTGWDTPLLSELKRIPPNPGRDMGPGTGVPPSEKDMVPVGGSIMGSRWGAPLPVNRHTHTPSRCTTYAFGNQHSCSFWKIVLSFSHN